MDPINPFKWPHFAGAIILLCVRWYLRYARAYRDLEEMLVERGLRVDHSTICRPSTATRRSWSNGCAPT